MTWAALLSFIGTLLQIFAYLIVARSLLSWFPAARDHPVVDLLHQITDPVMVPLQRLIPRFGMIDLSPMIAILVLFLLATALKPT